jgi:hypothetical protein
MKGYVIDIDDDGGPGEGDGGFGFDVVYEDGTTLRENTAGPQCGAAFADFFEGACQCTLAVGHVGAHRDAQRVLGLA